MDTYAERNRRKSFCDITPNGQLHIIAQTNEDHSQKAKPLHILSNIVSKRAQAHDKSAFVFGIISFIFVLMNVVAGSLNVVLSTIILADPTSGSEGVKTASTIFSAITLLTSAIIAKFSLETRVGRHRERSHQYKKLVTKLRLERYITPVEMWGNLFLEVLRDLESIESQAGVDVPEIIAPKSDKPSSNSDHDGQLLDIAPVPMRFGSDATAPPIVQRMSSLNRSPAPVVRGLPTPVPREETTPVSMHDIEVRMRDGSNRGSSHEMPESMSMSRAATLATLIHQRNIANSKLRGDSVHNDNMGGTHVIIDINSLSDGSAYDSTLPYTHGSTLACAHDNIIEESPIEPKIPPHPLRGELRTVTRFQST